MYRLITIFILISSLLLSQKKKIEPEFKISSDTIHFNSLSQSLFILKHAQKFYMLSEQDIQPYSTQSKKFLKIFNSNHLLEHESCLPNQLNTVYFDFFKKNDSLIYKKYLDNNTYYLDHNTEWKETYKSDDLIYKDKNFYVTSLDFGEFGKKTWFADRKNKKEYYTDIFTSIVNRVQNKYFITTSKNIYVLSDPKKLPEISKNDSYNKYKNSHKYPQSYVGFDILKSYFSTDKKDFYIITSFTSKNKLYHIYREADSTYIGRVQNNKMRIIQNLSNDIIPFSRYFNYRNKLQNNKQAVQFRTNSTNLTGIIEIDENKISIFYFDNKYSKNEPLGYPKAKIDFEKKIDFLFNNIGNINLETISNYEKQGIPIPYSMKLQYTGKKNQNFNGTKIYKITEDNYFELHTLYSYNEQNIIEGVTFNWNRNLDYENRVKFIDYDSIKKSKNERYSNIKNFLILKYGKPQVESEIGDTKKSTWVIDGKTIRLNQGTYYIEMKIFTN